MSLSNFRHSKSKISNQSEWDQNFAVNFQKHWKQKWKDEIMFREKDMKLSIWYKKILIYDRFHSNFHKKRISISNLNWYFFENCHFHIVSYRYRIISYQFLVPILWSRPCLQQRHKSKICSAWCFWRQRIGLALKK